jgi:hypothetical protein
MTTQKNSQSRASSNARKSVAAKFLDRLSGGSLLTDKQSKNNDNKDSDSKHDKVTPKPRGYGSWFSVGGGGGVGGNRRGGKDFKNKMRDNEHDTYFSDGGHSSSNGNEPLLMKGSSSRRRAFFASKDHLGNGDVSFNDDYEGGGFSRGTRNYEEHVAHTRSRYPSSRNYPRNMNNIHDDSKFRPLNRYNLASAYDEEGSLDNEMESSPVGNYRFGNFRRNRFLRRQPQFDDSNNSNIEDGSLIPEETYDMRNKGFSGLLSRGRRRSLGQGFYADPEMDGFVEKSEQDEDEDSIRNRFNGRKSGRLVDRLRGRIRIFRW